MKSHIKCHAMKMNISGKVETMVVSVEINRREADHGFAMNVEMNLVSVERKR